MRNVVIAGTMLALLSACGSQSDETPAAEPTAEASAATPAAPTPAETPAAPAAANAAPGDFAKGDTVEVAMQAECREVGPDADETPWTLYPGVTKEVLAVEGDQVRVKVGDTECLVPASSLKKS